jgi:hypothetical protein
VYASTPLFPVSTMVWHSEQSNGGRRIGAPWVGPTEAELSCIRARNRRLRYEAHSVLFGDREEDNSGGAEEILGRKVALRSRARELATECRILQQGVRAAHIGDADATGIAIRLSGIERGLVLGYDLYGNVGDALCTLAAVSERDLRVDLDEAALEILEVCNNVTRWADRNWEELDRVSERYGSR